MVGLTSQRRTGDLVNGNLVEKAFPIELVQELAKKAGFANTCLTNETCYLGPSPYRARGHVPELLQLFLVPEERRRQRLGPHERILFFLKPRYLIGLDRFNLAF